MNWYNNESDGKLFAGVKKGIAMMNTLNKYFPADILEKYEIYSYYHAAEILSAAYPNEFHELIDALRNVDISIDDILEAGGNESAIPPKFKKVLFPKGWAETRVHGDLHIELTIRSGEEENRSFVLQDYVNGYNIDFF